MDGLRRIPKLVAGIDIRKLPIGPEEAFLLSRVDGSAAASDLALGTGFEEARVLELLERLLALGAVEFPVPRSAATERDSRTPSEPEQVLRGLEGKDHYAVLNVPRSATRQEIKASYFTVIARYHPDRYFGASLGEAKATLERICARLTEAYDTLSRSELKARYDETLTAERVAISIPEAATSLELPRAPVNLGPASGHSTSSFTQSRPAAEPKSDSLHQLDPAARQKALARMLSTSVPPSRRSTSTFDAFAAVRTGRSSTTVPAMPAARRDEATGAGSAARAMITDIRLALARSPNDPILQRRLEEAERAMGGEETAELEARAKLAKEAGRLKEAANLFGRAARAHQSAEMYLEAARCSMSANDNPRRSAELAKCGLELAPDHAALHSLLGRIYAEAGMTSSALSALEKARRLDPSDEGVKVLLERVRNG